MHLKSTFKITFLCLFFLAFTVTAQPICPVNGISTDPAASVNNQQPSKRNVFDWNFTTAQPAYNANWFFTGQRPFQETPYNQPSNPNNDVDYLQGTHDTPTSGWELIKKDLGYTDGPNSTPTPTGVHNPYVIIYNKYTGILRVFWAVGDRQGSYQFCSIELGFDANNFNSASKTGLLNRVSGIGVALEGTTHGTDEVLTAMKAFPNTFGAWFVADFPMEYDPCTCLKQSTVRLKVRLISQAQVALSSRSTGTFASIQGGTGTGPLGSSDRATLAGVVHGATTTVNGVTSAFNGPFDFASHALGGSDAAVIQRFSQALNNNQFLRQGFKSLPYIGAALSVLDFFLGGGQDSGPQQVSMQPMSIDFTTTTSGTITYSNDWTGARFSTPGSQVRTQYLEDYPNYNEVLGVANLLYSPQFDVVNSGYDRAYPDINYNEYGYSYYTGGGGSISHLFHLKSDLKYVINPASGLRVKEMQASLLTSLNLAYPNRTAASVASTESAVAGGSLGSFTILGKRLDPNRPDLREVSTPFVDVGCLSGTVFSLEDYVRPVPESYPLSGPNAKYYGRGRLYLKLMLNLERINPTTTSQNTLMLLTFPIDEQNALTYAAPGSDPGGRDPWPPDDAALFGPLPACTSTTLLTPAATDAEVSDFCNNNAPYQAAVALRIKNNTAKGTSNGAFHSDNQALTQFECYPNPLADNGIIQFTLADQEVVHLFLVNELGMEVKEFTNAIYHPGFHKLAINTENILPGIYHCVLQTADRREILKIAVIK